MYIFIQILFEHTKICDIYISLNVKALMYVYINSLDKCINLTKSTFKKLTNKAHTQKMCYNKMALF